MSKRAVLIVTDGLYVDGVTLGTRRSNDDVREHLWLETSEQLLADLRTLARPWNSSVDVLVAARAHLRSLLPEEGKDA